MLGHSSIYGGNFERPHGLERKATTPPRPQSQRVFGGANRGRNTSLKGTWTHIYIYTHVLVSYVHVVYMTMHTYHVDTHTVQWFFVAN